MTAIGHGTPIEPPKSPRSPRQKRGESTYAQKKQYGKDDPTRVNTTESEQLDSHGNVIPNIKLKNKKIKKGKNYVSEEESEEEDSDEESD